MHSPIHNSSVKGLEYPHVFIIGLADGLFPNKRAIDGEGDLEEEQETFLCGCNPCGTLSSFSLPTLANQKGTPIRLMQSRFLKELPESRYELKMLIHATDIAKVIPGEIPIGSQEILDSENLVNTANC